MKTGICMLLLLAFSSTSMAGMEGTWQCNSTYHKRVTVGQANHRSTGKSVSSMKFNPDKTYVETDVTQAYPVTGEWRQRGRKVRLRPNLLTIQANFLSSCADCRYLGAKVNAVGRLNGFSTVLKSTTRLRLLSLENGRQHDNRVVTKTTCYRD